MGWIYWWSRLASLMPRVANFFSQTPILRDVAKWAGGIARERTLPPFADETFVAWFRRRGSRARTGSLPVLLWPDTFTNHFHPDIARAAVDVLETAGFEVRIPKRSLCCGRPLYDFGMLNTARRMLAQILETLRPEIRRSIPVVVLEPSCAAVFRDELKGLFPNDQDAKRLSQQTFLFSEFLNSRAKNFRWPQLRRQALVHGHCHQKALIGMQDEEEVLKTLGVDFDAPEAGCCGMAGSFGFEPGDHYEVSVACGERQLLPAVRRAPREKLVIADGFSCREQIMQRTDRRPLHLAQVVQMALRQDRDGTSRRVRRRPAPALASQPLALLGAGALLAGMAVGVWYSTSSKSS
jgi:Fe-S oxidoreductase